MLLCILHPTAVFSGTGDTISNLRLADHVVLNPVTARFELHVPDYPFFDVEAEKIFVGFELSNVHAGKTNRFLTFEIKKKSSQQFRLKPIVSKRIPVNVSSIYIDSLDLPDSLFASGNYDLIVSYLDDSLNLFDMKKSSFQLLRKQNAIVKDEFYSFHAESTDNHVAIEKTFVQKYDLDQLKKNVLSLSPLAKGAEQKVIKELGVSDDLAALKQFFYNFWYNRNPSAPEKGWTDYVVILNDMAKKYGNAGTPGYETDRGRIFIQYGEPDRIVKSVNEKNALPYEVWFYYRSGTKTNLKFLFFQPGMLGNSMLLLHSNITEEIINPYWKAMLLSDPDNGDNKLTHKVFEFFN